MAKEYKVGEGYFLPVKITSTDYDREFPVQFSYFDGQDHYTECVQDGTLLTAEEIVKASNLPAVLIEEGLTARITELEAKNATLAAELEEEKANTYGWTNTAEERGRLISDLKESLHEASEENAANDEALAQMSVKKAELEDEIEKLKRQLDGANELLSDAQAKVKELTEADCMRVQEFKPIIEERDRLKAEAATRTENVKNLVEENDRLRAEMDRLKKTLEERAENVLNLLEENDRLKKLLNSKEEGMRKIEEYADQLKKIADDLGDENEKLKAENDQERKRTQVWKDASEEHRQAAEELKADIERYEEDKTDLEWEVKRNESEINKLHADNLELKAQINAFRSDPKEVEELKEDLANARGQADLFKSERDEFDVQIQKYKDTLRKWSKKIHSQEAGIKQRDLIISLLAARAIELEEGGESNGQH